MSALWFRYRWEIRSPLASVLFFAAVLLLLGLLVVALTAKDTYHAHRLSSDGRMATATVVQKALHRAANNGTADTSFEVDYLFTTADGRRVDGSDTVDADTWDRIANHAPVEIQYSVSDPLINRIGASTGVAAYAVVVLVAGSALALLGAMVAVKGLLSLRTPELSSTESAAAADTDTDTDGSPRWQFRVKVSPWIIIGGILLIVGVSFRLIGDAKLREERLYQAAGLTATAIVEAKSSRVPERPQSAQSQHIHYFVSYRFTPEDGAAVRGSDEVDRLTWQWIREGDPIQIVYLRDQPARSRLAANTGGTAPQQSIVLGGTLAAIGAMFLGYGLYGVLRRHRKSRQ